MQFDKDITKIKRVTFFFETQCIMDKIVNVLYNGIS